MHWRLQLFFVQGHYGVITSYPRIPEIIALHIASAGFLMELLWGKIKSGYLFRQLDLAPP
jgi:hypothetical protein